MTKSRNPKSANPKSTNFGSKQSPTLWHRLLGKEMELALSPRGVTVLTEVQIGSNPPKVDIVLLRRESERWTDEQLLFLPDGIRKSYANHVLIEFKATETIHEESFQQAVGYDYFYWQGQQLKRQEIETFLLSALTPRSKTLAEFGLRQTDDLGVYRSDFPLLRKITLIVVNELTPNFHNAFVQCFASRRKIRNDAFARLLDDKERLVDEILWSFVAGLQTQTRIKEDPMAFPKHANEGLTPELVLETGRQIRKALVANLTPEERLVGLTAEERLSGLAPEERLSGLAPEERLSGLAPEERLSGLAPEERLSGLAPEEMLTLLERIEEYLKSHNIQRKK